MVAAALQVAIPHGECIVAIMHASKNATSHLLPATDDAWCGRSPHISCSPSSNLLTKLGKYSSWLLIICMVANEFSNNDSIHPSNDYFWNTCMYVYVCAGDGSEIELHIGMAWSIFLFHSANKKRLGWSSCILMLLLARNGSMQRTKTNEQIRMEKGN